MYLWFYFVILTFVILILLFIPDIFPKCSCCLRKKFKPFVRLHKTVGINPGYSGNRSVCTSCCRKYSIEDLKDLDRLISIKRKMRLDTLKKYY